jgi:hypothetical protein
LFTAAIESVSNVNWVWTTILGYFAITLHNIDGAHADVNKNIYVGIIIIIIARKSHYMDKNAHSKTKLTTEVAGMWGYLARLDI